MLDDRLVEFDQCPARALQTSAEIEFLSAVKIAVGQVLNRLYGIAAIKPAAVQSCDTANASFRTMPLAALFIFLIHHIRLGKQAANARQTGILSQRLECYWQEVGLQPHVAIHQQKVTAATVLKAELRTRSARSICRSV